MSDKYDRLDAEIIRVCRMQPRTFSEIRHNATVEPLALAAMAPDRHGNKDPFRLIDRRLQALRKAGKLTYSRSDNWRATPSQLAEGA